MKYRTQIGEFVRGVVQQMLTPVAAGRWLRKNSVKEIPEADRTQFIATVEVELRCLHEGNIARYRLRPGEFAQWKSGQPS